MTTVRTQSGSVYEIDDCRVRRLSGERDPTPRQGPDGEWRTCMGISGPEVGWPMTFMWSVDENVIKATMTSPVVSVE